MSSPPLPALRVYEVRNCPCDEAKWFLWHGKVSSSWVVGTLLNSHTGSKPRVRDLSLGNLPRTRLGLNLSQPPCKRWCQDVGREKGYTVEGRCRGVITVQLLNYVLPRGGNINSTECVDEEALRHPVFCVEEDLGYVVRVPYPSCLPPWQRLCKRGARTWP